MTATRRLFFVRTLGLLVALASPPARSAEAPRPSPPSTSAVRLTGFTWDRVPLNLHFGKRTADLADAEIDFIASHSTLIALEKSHGVTPHGSTEAGIADSARRIMQRNPNAKVLFYFNAFINWPGYDAFKTYRPEWTLRTATGEIVKHPGGTPRPDPSNAEFREWWSEVVATANRSAPLGGVFVDALPQALTPALARALVPHGEYRRERGDIVKGAILVERASYQRYDFGVTQRKNRAARIVWRLRRRNTPWRIRLIGHYSPGSTPGAGGVAETAPPIDTMRSIANCARAAMSAGTVMRCVSSCSDSSTFGSVVTFMYMHDARSLAA